MGTIFCICLVLVTLVLWRDPIWAFIQVMKLNSYEEFIEFTKILKDGAVQNKIIIIILAIFRGPLILLMLIPMIIKICILEYRRNKD